MVTTSVGWIFCSCPIQRLTNGGLMGSILGISLGDGETCQIHYSQGLTESPTRGTKGWLRKKTMNLCSCESEEHEHGVGNVLPCFATCPPPRLTERKKRKYSTPMPPPLLPWQAHRKASEKNTYVVDQRLEKNVALRCIPAWTLKIASDRFKAVTQAEKDKQVFVYVCAIA